LASPKARRIALEKGVNLGDLRAQGVQEPILASDLSKAATGGQSCLTAIISGAALDALLASSDGADRAALFVAFAAGAWRAVFHTEAAIRRLSLDGETEIIGNEPAALTFIDLCGTRLTSFARAGGGTTLTAAQQGDGVTLTLSFSETSLPITQAVTLLDEIAARVEDPIRQLL
jgi:pyruvate/2-oxoglutarate dehydrogenase complex dihydrolipoamide acyltransferase (E2) component